MFESGFVSFNVMYFSCSYSVSMHLLPQMQSIQCQAQFLSNSVLATLNSFFLNTAVLKSFYIKIKHSRPIVTNGEQEQYKYFFANNINDKIKTAFSSALFFCTSHLLFRR